MNINQINYIEGETKQFISHASLWHLGIILENFCSQHKDYWQTQWDLLLLSCSKINGVCTSPLAMITGGLLPRRNMAITSSL